jgi:hypothetical protein
VGAVERGKGLPSPTRIRYLAHPSASFRFGPHSSSQDRAHPGRGFGLSLSVLSVLHRQRRPWDRPQLCTDWDPPLCSPILSHDAVLHAQELKLRLPICLVHEDRLPRSCRSHSSCQSSCVGRCRATAAYPAVRPPLSFTLHPASKDLPHGIRLLLTGETQRFMGAPS